MKIKLLIIFVLSILLLLLLVNTQLPYEQDQGSKAAKIILMVKTNTIYQPTVTESMYNDALLSFYYIVSSSLYKIIGGNIFSFMNISSVIMGAFFYTCIAWLLKVELNIEPITCWVIFFNVPILISTFSYGNEVAFSITFFIISLLFLAIHVRWNWIISLLFLSFSIFSRPDILFLIPFWTAWDIFFHQRKKTIRQKIIIIIKYAFVGISIFVVYFLVFLRNFTYPTLAMQIWAAFHTNIKLLIGMLSYPFNISIILLGALGFILLLRDKRKFALVLLLLAMPLFFYVWNLTSPKFIISLSILFGITAAYFINNSKRWLKVISTTSLLLWYFVSITPYGIFFQNSGSGMVVPTSDGAIPTGSYIWFYQNAHTGFYQRLYKSEIESFTKAFAYIKSHSTEKIAIVGSFNLQFADLILAQSDQYTMPREWIRQHVFLSSFPTQSKAKYLLLQRTYLSINKMDTEIKEQFLSFLNNGRVRSLDGDNVPFPSVIEVGESIPYGYDFDLSKRILFAINYYQNYGFLYSDIFYSYYWPTFWVPSVSATQKDEYPPLYQDSQWTAYTQEESNSQPWMLELPYYFTNERNPNLPIN